MRIDIGSGVRIYVDVDGLGLVPIDGKMVPRPTLLLLHGARRDWTLPMPRGGGQ